MPGRNTADSRYFRITHFDQLENVKIVGLHSKGLEGE